MSLNNTTVVVLGGSSGIGLATAQAAQAEGARVIITGRDAGRLETARVALGGHADAKVLDAADDLGVPLPATSLIFNLYRTLEAQGLSSEGNHGLMKALEHLAGFEVGSAQ